MLVAVLVDEGKIRGGDGLGGVFVGLFLPGAAFRRILAGAGALAGIVFGGLAGGGGVRLLLRNACPVRCPAKARQIAGNAVHETGQGHNAHENKQRRADFYRVAHDALVLFKELQHRAGKKADRQKRKHKAGRINGDQQESPGGGGGGTGHQKNASQSRADAGRPGKAEGKAQRQGRERPHRPAAGQKRQPAFPLQRSRPAKQAQLVQAEQDHNNAARAGKERLAAAEKAPQGGKAKAKQKERKADTEDKKQRVDQDPPLWITDRPVLGHRLRPARKIADVQRDDRQDAGREKAQKPL